MIKNFKEFLNENKTWYPTFKAQGEYINKKDSVTTEELQKIAYYFNKIYKMDNIKIGKLENGSYGVSGEASSSLKPYYKRFQYYWKASSDSELEDIESGWLGKGIGDKIAGQFMSPFEFLECVEMDYFYSNVFQEDESKKRLAEMKSVMGKLAMQSDRRINIISKKFGL